MKPVPITPGDNMNAGGEYPKMLFKAGGVERIHGLECATVVVEDVASEETLLGDGWRSTPAKAHGASAEPAKPAADPEELAQLRAELALERERADNAEALAREAIDELGSPPADPPRRGRPPKVPE